MGRAVWYGKRPDEATKIPWTRERYVAQDTRALIIHTCASPYVHLTASTTGREAAQPVDRKRTNYANLAATHDFIPVAIESLGLINTTVLEFFQKLGKRMAEATGDPRETTYLFQRPSIFTWRFNDVAFISSFEQDTRDKLITN